MTLFYIKINCVYISSVHLRKKNVALIILYSSKLVMYEFATLNRPFEGFDPTSHPQHRQSTWSV